MKVFPHIPSDKLPNHAKSEVLLWNLGQIKPMDADGVSIPLETAQGVFLGHFIETTFFFFLIGHARNDHLRNLHVLVNPIALKKDYKMSRTTFSLFIHD